MAIRSLSDLHCLMVQSIEYAWMNWNRKQLHHKLHHVICMHLQHSLCFEKSDGTHLWNLESSWCGINGYQPLQFTPSVELDCLPQCHAKSVYIPLTLHKTLYTKPSNPSENNKAFPTLTPARNQTGQIGTKGVLRLRQIMRIQKWWDEAATFLLGKVIEVKNSTKKHSYNEREHFPKCVKPVT